MTEECYFNNRLPVKHREYQAYILEPTIIIEDPYMYLEGKIYGEKGKEKEDDGFVDTVGPLSQITLLNMEAITRKGLYYKLISFHEYLDYINGEECND